MHTFQTIEKTELSPQERLELLSLWNYEYPVTLSLKNLTEFDHYLASLIQSHHFLLKNPNDEVLGWAFTFERDNEKWFAIILSESLKGRGIGKKLIDELKRTESTLNGWVIDHNNYKKINEEVYRSPLGFYEKCGFTALNEVRLETDKISAVKITWTKNASKNFFLA